MSNSDQLAELLMQTTSNLAAYIEEQAQLIARPKIEAAEGRFRSHAASAVAEVITRAERAEAIAIELRRQITALERQRDKAQMRDTRVRAVADDLDARDLHDAATQIRNALNFVGHTASTGRR